MKSREEYMASIYTKRDARLAKRKRAITVSVSALCLILCFCAAAVVMPEMINKSSGEATVADDSKNVQTTYSDIQYVTMIAPYEKPKEERIGDSILQSKKHFDCNTSASANKKVTVFEESEAVEECETEIAQEFHDGGTNAVPSPTKKSSAIGKYTSNEIISAAYDCLTENEKKAAEGVEPFVTVTRTSGGNEYYDISYGTDNGKIKIILNAESLELIEKVVDADSTQGITSVVMTTPAFNPNS